VASSKGYLDFILAQLCALSDITYRAMMGESILYYRGKVVGGIYDDRFLVKPTPSAIACMPDASRELPYEGAKEMLLVDNVDDREQLARLLDAMYEELPAPKPKKPKKKGYPPSHLPFFGGRFCFWATKNRRRAARGQSIKRVRRTAPEFLVCPTCRTGVPSIRQADSCSYSREEPTKKPYVSKSFLSSNKKLGWSSTSCSCF